MSKISDYMTSDYMMADDVDAIVNVRTVPGGSIPSFPALQIGPLCLYASKDQLHDIMSQIDDYLETVGYYDELEFEAEPTPFRSPRLDIEELFAVADAAVETEEGAARFVAAEAAIGSEEF